mgnify:CR=1 FL=1
MIKKVAILTNQSRDVDLVVTRRLVQLFKDCGVSTVLEAPLRDRDWPEGTEFTSFSDADLIMALGGDGTFLTAVHYSEEADLPIIGVNLGSVGFLMEIDPAELAEAVHHIVNEEYEVEKRMMLNVRLEDDQGNPIVEAEALNDIVIYRGDNSRILTLDLAIDDLDVERVPGDGMIVSTPTGSTAYSLAAGGPIVHPLMQMTLITPISPHTLHNRTYIARPDSAVILTVNPYPNGAKLSVDGRLEYTMKSGYRAVIRRAKRELRLIRLGKDEFYQILPDKIHMRGRSR